MKNQKAIYFWAPVIFWALYFQAHAVFFPHSKRPTYYKGTIHPGISGTTPEVRCFRLIWSFFYLSNFIPSS